MVVKLRESCSWISRWFVVIRRLFNDVISLRLTLARWSRAAVLKILVYFDCLRFFFWHKHLSITLNLKYPEKPNYDLWPKHYAKFILEIGQWGSNGPPSVILGGPFQERGSMGRTGRTLCRHFGTFLAAEKAWARINAESRMCVWWNNDSNEEEKGNWDSKRLLKVKVSL